jgi:TolA-binding protein
VHTAKQWLGEQDLKEARYLLGAGHYSASEKKTLSVLEAFPQTLGDEALFQMGLIYGHPKNPNGDYEKSKAFFEKLVMEYPDSSRKEDAAVWLLTITRILGRQKETVELQKKVALLEQTSEARGKKLKQLQEELEAKEKENNEHRDAVNQLQSRVNELEYQLARFKNIDLTIEQKKRATVP